MHAATDSSSISFTAYYTGEVWRRHGLSDPLLASSQGRLLYAAGCGVERASRLLFGTNNEIMLLQRHRMLDHLLRQAIRERGVRQVVELACGLSPRGLCLRRELAGQDLLYVEADLPGMAQRKRRLLARAGALGALHRVVDCDILERDTERSLEAVFARELDAGRPTLVITEGLVNYFEYDVIHPFWTRLAAVLRAFPHGTYLTDLYPNFRGYPLLRAARVFRSGLAWATRSRVSLHFGDEAELHAGFAAAGFDATRLHAAEDYAGVLELPRQRGRSFIRVVESRVGAA